MYTYLVVFVYISLFVLAESVNLDRRIKIFGAVSVFFILQCLAGLRYETGVDWKAYGDTFDYAKSIYTIVDDVKSGYYKNDIDVGFVALCSLVKTFGGSIQAVFFISSLFTLSILAVFLKKYTPNPLTAILIYYTSIFFVLDMSGMRQCIAVSLFLVSIKYILEKRPMRYVLIILLAGTFHWSAFFLVPLYYILNKNFPTRNIAIFFVLSLIVFFFKIQWLKKLLIIFFPFISNGKMMQKAFLYTSAVTYATARELSLATIVNILYFIVMTFLVLKYRKLFIVKFKYFNVILNIFICNIFIFFCTSELIDISARMQFYFLLSNVILISYLTILFKRSIEKFIVSVIIIMYSAGYSKSYIFESVNTIAYSPYQNYIIYKTFDIKSTGKTRLQMHQKIHIKDGVVN
jgi:hypothetical protein